MNRLLLSLLLIVAAGVVHQANAQANDTTRNVLTLDQAIAIALKNNREAKNARLEIEKADDKLDPYRTRRLPSFKISSSHQAESLNLNVFEISSAISSWTIKRSENFR